MDTQFQKLVAAVLPEAGEICIFSKQLSSGDVRQKFFHDIGAAEEFIDNQVKAKYETYFGCMTFVENAPNRFAKYTHGYRTIFIDIDCGPEKKYLDRDVGLAALNRFVSMRRLPQPWIVDSGNGWHCYFPFEETVDYNDWAVVAEAFAQTAVTEGFFVDRQCTMDGVRVLRVPGTFNFKKAKEPKPVCIAQEGETVSIEKIKACLDFLGLDFAKPNFEIEEIDDATKSLIRKGEFRFDKILSRSLKQEETTIETPIREERPDGTVSIKHKKEKMIVSAGCAQLAKIHNDPKRSEPEWRFALSIANYCVDKDVATVEVSKNYYKGYDEAERLDKIARLKAPQTCNYVQNRSDLDAAVCLNCQWKGKIKTPISLGRHIPPAKPMDNILEDVVHQNLQQKITTVIPSSYPSPWFRPKQGGVAIYSAGESEADAVDTDQDSTLVYQHDLWAIGREEDPDAGEVLRIARLLPIEGLKEFTIPLDKVINRNDCMKCLAFHGVAVDSDHKAKLLQKYMVNWMHALQHTSDKKVARTQFGWADGHTKFIIGNREIDTNGNVTLIPSSLMTKSLAPKYTTSGNIDSWKAIANSYGNPGNEARAFILFLSMGTPLYEFFLEGSAIVHLTNTASGVGKTTIQKVAASVWGHPVNTMMNESDTALAIQHRAGTLHNLPVLIDEITNFGPEKSSDFAYRMSFNRGKNRMESHINAERENHTQYSTVTVTSGNNSLHDTLVAHRQAASGELYRVLEIIINKDTNLNTAQSGPLFRSLHEHYGIVGEELLKYMVPNIDHCKQMLFDIQGKFDDMIERSEEERFYSMIVATALTGGYIGAQLGLHNIPVKRIYKWAVELMTSTRGVVNEKSTVDPKAILGNYLSQMTRNTLVIKHDRSAPSAKDPYIPLGELNVRYETDRKLLFIKATSLTHWCNEKRITFNPFKQGLYNLGLTADIHKYNLALGTSLPATNVQVITIKADRLELPEGFDNVPTA
jgi:hypothetical protein